MKRLISWLGLVTLFSLASLFTVLIYPVTVSYDGYLYLGSANALLDKSLASQYHWLREPFYPFVVGVVNQVGGAKLLVFTQALMLISSIYALLWQISSWRPIAKRTRIICSIFIYLGVAGFAASVLQQALIFSLSTAFLLLLLNGRKFSLMIPGVILLASLGYLTSAILAAGLIALLFGFTLLVRTAPLRMRFWSLLAGVASIALTHASWNYFRDKLIEGSNPLLPTDSFSGGINAFNQFEIWDKVLGMPSTVAALNGFGIEFYQGSFSPAGNEFRLFGMPSLVVDQECGRFFAGPQEYLERATLDFEPYCVDYRILEVVSFANSILGVIIIVLSLIGFISIVRHAIYAFRGKNWEFVFSLIAPQLLLLPYVLANGAISRYGLFAIVFNLIFALLLTFRFSASALSPKSRF